MTPKYTVSFDLESNPVHIRQLRTDFETLFLIIGAFFLVVGTPILLMVDAIPGIVFIVIGLGFIVPVVLGYIKFMASVKKNHSIFFEPVKTKISNETGLKISHANIAEMWMEDAVKTRGHRFRAQARKGKSFEVVIY